MCVLCWVLVVVAVAAVVGNELTGNGAEVGRVALDVVPLRVLHFVEELVWVGRSVVVVVVETIYVDLSRLLVRVLHRLVWSVEGLNRKDPRYEFEGTDDEEIVVCCVSGCSSCG